MPHELALFGVYFSPLLAVVPAGVAAALVTAVVLNLTGISAWFANPPWVFLALIVIYICIFLPFGMVL